MLKLNCLPRISYTSYNLSRFALLHLLQALAACAASPPASTRSLRCLTSCKHSQLAPLHLLWAPAACAAGHRAHRHPSVNDRERFASFDDALSNGNLVKRHDAIGAATKIGSCSLVQKLFKAVDQHSHSCPIERMSVLNCGNWFKMEGDAAAFADLRAAERTGDCLTVPTSLARE
jgi:hypothetical protein